MGVALTGSIVGLVLAAFGGRALAGMLYGVSALDPATYGAVTAVVVLTALVASALPALRAARVDPTEVLRDE
jgi:putative ABC transport system permease protein